MSELENPVGERRLAVVDVRDDREVADVLLVHGLTGDGSRRADFPTSRLAEATPQGEQGLQLAHPKHPTGPEIGERRRSEGKAE